MKTISVIVPIYYGEKYIPDIIRQVEAGRTYLEAEDFVEIILVNDSPEVPIPLRWMGQNIHIKVINMDTHLGIHGARIRGLMEAQGEYIVFLDQDDKIKPEYFYKQIQEIGESDAVVCEAIHKNKLFYPNHETFKRMITKKYLFEDWNPIVSPGQVLLKRASIPDEWINHRIYHNGDDDLFLWICMMTKGCSFSLNYNVLYEHIIQENNASNNIVKMRQSEQEVIYIIQKKKILSNDEFNVLLNGFFKKNIASIYQLESLETKLFIIEKWINLKEKGIIFSDYLKQLELKTIAIYGCGVVGKYLYNEVSMDVSVKCFIDKNSKNIREQIPVYSLEEEIPDVDGVIITLIQNYEAVLTKLESKRSGKILILKEWLLAQ